MTPAEQALQDLVDQLVEIRQFLVEHGQGHDFGALSNLGAMAVEGRGNPEQTLADIWRASLRMGHPDGPWDIRMSDGSGGVDQLASRRLSELMDRLDAIINAWGPPEREE